MLACARIGAVHSVVFAGFSAESLSSRLTDSQSKIVLTATAVMRGTKRILLKAIVCVYSLLNYFFRYKFVKKSRFFNRLTMPSRCVPKMTTLTFLLSLYLTTALPFQ